MIRDYDFVAYIGTLIPVLIPILIPDTRWDPAPIRVALIPVLISDTKSSVLYKTANVTYMETLIPVLILILITENSFIRHLN